MDLTTNEKLTWVEHAVVAASVLYFGGKLFGGAGLKANLTRFFIKAARAMPVTSGIVAAQESQSLNKIVEYIREECGDDPDLLLEMPEQGRSPEQVLALLRAWREREKSYREGRAFGGIYHDGHEHEELQRSALAIYADSNALYPTIFPGLRKFEAEICAMTCKMLRGGEEAVGAMTSGGTESILMAIKVYRDRGRKLYGITEPEVLICASAHAAFIKGAHYFGCKFVRVPFGKDFRLDMDEVRRLMNPNVVMVMGSAPSFPHGVIDPIEELSDLVLQHPQCGLHVDACLGAFALPFLQDLGLITKKFSFDLPGVTSISADIHKYGNGPKGTSVIAWKNKDWRRFQYFAYCDWSGGLYCSPSMQGSRAGGPIAAAYAAIIHLGKEGYTNVARETYAVWKKLVDGINEIDGLSIVGSPDALCFAYVSNDKNLEIFKVADAMGKFGWTVNRMQKPRCVQQQIAYRQHFDADKYLANLQESVRQVKENPQDFKDGLAGVYGVAADLADASAIEAIEPLLYGYMDVLLTPNP